MTSTPSVEDILTRCAAAYANCRTYQDSGEATTTLIVGPRPSSPRLSRLVFRTCFRRPNSWYFDYRDMSIFPVSEWQHLIVVANDKGMVERRTIRPARADPHGSTTVSEALRVLIAASEGTSGFIPRLLRPTDHPVLPDAASTTIVGRESIQGHICYRLHAEHDTGRGSDMWIDADESMIRREAHARSLDGDSKRELVASLRDKISSLKRDVSRRGVFGATSLEFDYLESRDFREVCKTTFSPRFDVDIDPSVFEFHPPEEAS